MNKIFHYLFENEAVLVDIEALHDNLKEIGKYSHLTFACFNENIQLNKFLTQLVILNN